MKIKELRTIKVLFKRMLHAYFMLIYVNFIAVANAIILRLYNKVSTKGGLTEFTSTVSLYLALSSLV